MAKRNTLKQEYYKTTFNSYWKDAEGKPNIEYVNWLEDKINAQSKVNVALGSVSNSLKRPNTTQVLTPTGFEKIKRKRITDERDCC